MQLEKLPWAEGDSVSKAGAWLEHTGDRALGGRGSAV